MLRGLWAFVRPYAGWWAGSAVMSVFAVAAGLAIPTLVGRAIDDIKNGAPRGEQLGRIALMVVLASFAAGLLLVVMRFMAPVAARKVACDLRGAIFDRLTLLEPAYFQKIRTGDLINRYTAEVFAVQNLIGFGAIGFFNLLLNIVLSLVLMTRIAVPLGLAVAVAFPLSCALLVFMLRTAEKRYEELQDQQAELSSKVQENLTAIRLIKATGAEHSEEERFRQIQDEYLRRVLRHERIQQPLIPTARLLIHLMFAGSLLLVAPLLISNGGAAGSVLTLGQFVAFLTYLFLLLTPLYWFGEVMADLQRGTVSWGRVRQLLEAEPKIRSGGGALPAARGELAFENVSLEIDGRKLIDGVSFKVPAGKTVGLTGRTGAGKSLLGALLTRLLDPTSGRITLDGVDLRELPLEALRGAVALVPQEPFLFSRSIAENIALAAAPDAERIRKVAAAADLLTNVEAFPQKFDTLVGERGVTLSGGQRQRTAIARALLRDAKVLVLDDALSAVDAETEARILGELKTQLMGRTVMLIGHRIATFRHADEILVLDKGRIVERGTHKELIEKGAVYAELERRQRLAESLELHG